MYRDTEPWIIVGVATVCLSLMVGVIWYHHRYPCIQYKAVWVEAYTEIQLISMSCGKDCTTTYPVPIYHPAHWEQQCMTRGDRTKGDVEAAYAPIPNGVER